MIEYPNPKMHKCHLTIGVEEMATLPARDFAKFRWALANLAEDGSP